MQMIEISKLKSHPRNHEFFDDIVGEKWKQFKDSITRRGVVEAVVATEDINAHELIIVSGHQRVRAAKEIGILEVPCNIVHYPEEDERLHIKRDDMILEDLISTNIMQRGVGNINPMKMCKCINELERIYGIRHGSAGKGKLLEENNSCPKTQEQLAQELGLDDSQLRNYKKLNNLIPELQNLVKGEGLKGTTAYKIWAKLPQDEQENFFNEIGRDKIKKLTQKQTQEEINKIKNKYENENEQLKQQLNIEKSKEPKVIETVIDNTDYNSIEKLNKQLNKLRTDKEFYEQKVDNLETQLDLYQKDSDNYKNLKNQIETLTKEKNDIGRQIESTMSLSKYTVSIQRFLETELAPIQYNKALLESKDNPIVINNLKEIVECVEKWCGDIRKYLPQKYQNIIVNMED